jgi:hypothetical protein
VSISVHVVEKVRTTYAPLAIVLPSRSGSVVGMQLRVERPLSSAEAPKTVIEALYMKSENYYS